MLLKEDNSGFHWLNLVESSVFNHLDISEDSHDLEEKSSIRFLINTSWKNLNSIGDFLNEVLNVLDLLHSVIKEEASVGINPVGDGHLEFLDQRSGVNSKPSNVN